MYLQYIQSALSCIVYLVGLVAGIIALVRKKTVLGILATAGFFLLGINLIVSLALPTIIGYIGQATGTGGNGVLTTYRWLSFCIQVPLFLLGMGAIIAFIFNAIGRKSEKAAAETPEIPPVL
jgi:hypothetical protein